ncbi:hypothetical protein CEXT_210701 [Caerostris extrusa]|uniref:Uncharacterized protein n=1 Tax=Caerostris extrusa TaxID=172846 RepID=A0AAV4XKX5_CAEEX|nr:hypothetical protein CEXT_210701 [Caerostris extrusa]
MHEGLALIIILSPMRITISPSQNSIIRKNPSSWVFQFIISSVLFSSHAFVRGDYFLWKNSKYGEKPEVENFFSGIAARNPPLESVILSQGDYYSVTRIQKQLSALFVSPPL